MNRLWSREEGVAMIAAMGSLAVLGLVTAVLASSAVKLSDDTNDDRDSKRALAAAEAGLQAAVFRANKVAPANDKCLTNVAVNPSGGECPAYSQDMGNGASYSYRVTPVLGANDVCSGLPAQSGQNGTVVVERCVTATGTVNGEKRRTQIRTAAFQGAPIYPVGGMVGLDSIKLDNSSTVNGSMGSNGQITLGNSSTATSAEIGPSAPNPSVGNSSSIGTTIRRTPAQGPLVLSPVDVGNSATVNDNSRITNGQDARTGVTYNATTRVLTLGNSSSLTLGGATYNFCRINATNSAQLKIAAGAKVRIFVDSPDRAGSGCGSGTGTFTANNSITFDNPSGVAENMQIYVYGTNAPNTINFWNSVDMRNVSFYAPNSKIIAHNSATITGGMAAKSIEFKNSVTYTWANSLSDLRARTLALYYRTAWRECRPEPTNAADPESGCG